jgi:hypothetical protein
LNLQKLSSSLLVCPSASSSNCAPDPGPPVPLKRMQVDVKVGRNGDEGDVWPGQIKLTIYAPLFSFTNVLYCYPREHLLKPRRIGAQ